MAKKAQQIATKMKPAMNTAATFHEPVRSFCARVIQLCTNVQDIMKLTYLQGLKDEARRLMNEAKVVQSVYGGHPRGDLPKRTPIVDKPTKKNMKRR